MQPGVKDPEIEQMYEIPADLDYIDWPQLHPFFIVISCKTVPYRLPCFLIILTKLSM